MNCTLVLPALVVLGLSGCGPAPRPESSDTLPQIVNQVPTGAPMPGLSDDQLEAFERGGEIFETHNAESQGLGPLYIKDGCVSCHEGDARGPGTVTRMVVMNADGVTGASV